MLDAPAALQFHDEVGGRGAKKVKVEVLVAEIEHLCRPVRGGEIGRRQAPEHLVGGQLGKPHLLGDAQKEPHEPIREVQAQHEEGGVLERAREIRHHGEQMGLQRERELHRVFLPHDVFRQSGNAAEEMEHVGAGELARGQIARLARGIRQHLRPAGACSLNGRREKRIKSGRQEKPELLDPGQAVQGGSGCERRILEETFQLHVRPIRYSAAESVGGNHVVQTRGQRQQFGVDGERFRQARRQPRVERLVLLAVGDGGRSDDGDNSPFFD